MHARPLAAVSLAALVAAAAAVLPLAGCGGAPVPGSGKVVTKSLAAPGPFTSVRGEGALRLTLVVGPAPGITVETDDNLQELVRTEAKDGSLRIWTEDPFTSKDGMKVTVTAPSFSGLATGGAVWATADLLTRDGAPVLLSAAGSSRIEVGTVKCPTLKVSAQGSSVVTVGASSPDAVDVWASGAPKVTVHATCTKATVRAEGAAKVGDATLQAKNADVIVTGTSRVDLDVSETLQADATGNSQITYGGDPKVKGASGAASFVGPRPPEKP